MPLHRHHLTAAATALLLALAATGCGFTDDTTSSTTVTDASPADATDSPAPATQTQPGPGTVKITPPDTSDPRIQTAMRYATAAVSFTPENWIDQQVRLKELAVGTERQQLESNTSVLQRQQQALMQDRQTSVGRVLGVDVSRSDETTATVIVILKVTGTGEGRSNDPAAADYDIAEVGLTLQKAGWRVDQYEIQP